MKNRNVGWLIIGISVVIFAIIWIFNYGVANALNATCSMGPGCSMYKTLSIQTWISVAIAAIVLIIGLFLVFAEEPERIVVKKIKEKKTEIDMASLEKDEKQIVKILESENGAIFQSALMEKLGMGKVGMTRVLDKLEAKQIIERKRRGMNNIVVLKTR
jgi:uncharacterized membrane protein